MDVDIGWLTYRENIKTVEFTGNPTMLYQSAFAGCKNLTSINLPESITSIGHGAFSGCTSIKKLDIPSGVTSIASSAFSQCKSLESITIPAGVTSIGSWTFSGCSSLKEVTVPGNVTSIGDYAFEYCTGLEKVTINNGVTSIGNGAFYNCKNLENVTIPASVTTIGDYAFLTDTYYLGEGKLKDINYGGTKEDWEKINIDPDKNKVISDASIHLIDGTVIPGAKLNNTLKVTGKTAKVKQNVARAKVMVVSNPQGKVSYKLLSVNKKKSYFKVNAANGVVTIKKKLKKGTYTLKVLVTASGNDGYWSGSKTVAFKIKVK